MAEKSFQETSSQESGSAETNFGAELRYDDTKESKASVGHRIVDSFRKDPSLKITSKGVVGANGKVFDVEAAAVATAESPLARKLKGRHLQMIAIGGSIGK